MKPTWLALLLLVFASLSNAAIITSGLALGTVRISSGIIRFQDSSGMLISPNVRPDVFSNHPLGCSPVCSTVDFTTTMNSIEYSPPAPPTNLHLNGMVYNAVFSPVATALAPYYATLEATFTGPIATISTTPPVNSSAPTIYEGRGVFRMTGLLTIRDAATGAIVLSENLSGSGLARSDVWVFPSGAVDSYMGYFFDTTSVPEPGSAALAAFGAGLIIWRIRSRSRGRQSAAGQR